MVRCARGGCGREIRATQAAAAAINDERIWRGVLLAAVVWVGSQMSRSDLILCSTAWWFSSPSLARSLLAVGARARRVRQWKAHISCLPSPAPRPVCSASNALAGELCVVVLGRVFCLVPSPRAPPTLALELVISCVRLLWPKPKSARRPSIGLQWGWQIFALPRIAARKIFKLQCRFMGDRTQLRRSLC